jgi:hypothetical protein
MHYLLAKFELYIYRKRHKNISIQSYNNKVKYRKLHENFSRKTKWNTLSGALGLLKAVGKVPRFT